MIKYKKFRKEGAIYNYFDADNILICSFDYLQLQQNFKEFYGNRIINIKHIANKYGVTTTSLVDSTKRSSNKPQFNFKLYLILAEANNLQSDFSKNIDITKQILGNKMMSATKYAQISGLSRYKIEIIKNNNIDDLKKIKYKNNTINKIIDTNNKIINNYKNLPNN